MQLSAVCAAATVSAWPGRQTEEGCFLRLTLLTLGQHNATNKAEANKQHVAMFTMLLCNGVMLQGLGNMPKISGHNLFVCCFVFNTVFIVFLTVGTCKLST